MIGNPQVSCCLGIAGDAFIDVTIRDEVHLADARLIVPVGILLSPWGRGHGPQRRGSLPSPMSRA